MELELIYSEMAYEDARHLMELRHINCIKVEEYKSNSSEYF